MIIPAVTPNDARPLVPIVPWQRLRKLNDMAYEHGIVCLVRSSSSASGNSAPEFKRSRGYRHFGIYFATGKLSNKLSTPNWVDSANHHLARQVHHRHVLTLWGTTGWCSRRESNPEPWD
jgi:hypothetical protein